MDRLTLKAFAKKIDTEARTIEATASTGSIDRDNEIIEPQAFKASLKAFMKNPVLIAGHVYQTLTGEPTVIGRVKNPKITDDGLVFEAEFAGTDLAEKYWELYKPGYMKAFSVGFLAKKWIDGTGEEGPRRTFQEVELLEISAVAIPSNRDALARAATKGMDLAEELLKELPEEPDLEALAPGTKNDPEPDPEPEPAVKVLSEIRDLLREIKAIFPIQDEKKILDYKDYIAQAVKDLGPVDLTGPEPDPEETPTRLGLTPDDIKRR